MIVLVLGVDEQALIPKTRDAEEPDPNVGDPFQVPSGFFLAVNRSREAIRLQNTPILYKGYFVTHSLPDLHQLAL